MASYNFKTWKAEVDGIAKRRHNADGLSEDCGDECMTDYYEAGMSPGETVTEMWAD